MSQKNKKPDATHTRLIKDNQDEDKKRLRGSEMGFGPSLLFIRAEVKKTVKQLKVLCETVNLQETSGGNKALKTHELHFGSVLTPYTVAPRCK